MANYTIEFYKLQPNIFDFDYELYNNEMKPYFEKFVLDYFYFNEIGFETIGRFKKALQNKLNVIAYKYKEYYKTVLEVETRDFMNTKEIFEEFTRELNGENISSITSSDTTNGTNTNIFSATPKQSINTLEHYMTQGSKDTSNMTNNSNGTSTSENTTLEKTTFKSEGNLGVSSDGFLVEKWREIIVDINQKICEDELSELFMLIY